MSLFKIWLENKDLRDYYNTSKNYSSDCGFDLYMPTDVVINPNDTVLVDLEIKTEFLDKNNINLGYIICPRSSIYKKKIRLANSIGIIDPEYRGNLKVALDNIGNKPEILLKGERYFQIIFVSMIKPDKILIVDEVEKLSLSKRDNNGFGSTGL